MAWGKGATAPNYNQAVSNTRMVGTQLRLIIDMMVRAGGKVGDMHLIGHSLGAHTAGYTGRLLHGRLGRITGEILGYLFSNHTHSVNVYTCIYDLLRNIYIFWCLCL